MNTWQRPSGRPAATQRSQNPDTMSLSDVPARPAWVSHADKSAKKFSFISRLYRLRHSEGLVLAQIGRKSFVGLGPLVRGFRTLVRSVSDFSLVPQADQPPA